MQFLNSVRNKLDEINDHVKNKVDEIGNTLDQMQKIDKCFSMLPLILGTCVFIYLAYMIAERYYIYNKLNETSDKLNELKR